MRPSQPPFLRPDSRSKVGKTTSQKSRKSLRSGRPPTFSTTRTTTTTTTTPQPPIKGINISDRPSLLDKSTAGSFKRSSKATKSLINAHHNLHKSRAKAAAAGQTDLVHQIDEQIAQLGGLQAYQQASLTGQSADRGGDSSAVLVKWLEELVVQRTNITNPKNSHIDRDGPRLRVLEIGALSSRNAVSRAATRTHAGARLIESVKRIDLKSQEPELIEEIDFMDLAVPTEPKHKYDVISLSLVLNFVAQPGGRGNMLRRTREFLRSRELDSSTTTQQVDTPQKEAAQDTTPGRSDRCVPPSLFVVLPLPCLTNSRYLNEDRFRELMSVLGYESIRAHQSSKLHYELFCWNGTESSVWASFRKVEVNPGKGRNNFCITLEPGE